MTKNDKAAAHKKLKKNAIILGLFAFGLCELCSFFHSKKLIYMFWTGNIALVYMVYELFMMIKQLRVCPSCKSKKFVKKCKSCGFKL